MLRSVAGDNGIQHISKKLRPFVLVNFSEQLVGDGLTVFGRLAGDLYEDLEFCMIHLNCSVQ